MSNRLFTKIMRSLTLCLIAVIMLGSQVVTALSSEQKRVIQGGVRYYNTEEPCDPNGTNSSSSANIYVLGDSLTVGMEQAGLETKLTEKGWNADESSIEATSGDTIAKALPKVDAASEKIKQSGVVVIALGTNKDANFSDKLVELVEKVHDIAPAAKVYWMNAYTTVANYDDINAVIDAQSTPLNYSVIDWRTEVTTFPDKYPFAEDGIHHTGEGYAAKADYLVNTLGSPSGGQTTGQVSAGTANQSYDGQPVWTEDELAKVEANKSFYIQASEAADVPWQMIAVIHRLESGLGRFNDDNGQGIYQFYSGAGGPYPTGPVDDAEFLRQTIFMAERLQNDFVTRNHSSNAGPLKASGTPDNTIKDTFFSYNGRAGIYKNQAAALGFDRDSQGYEGSPYVMNRVDERRDPATATPGTWGQVKEDNGPLVYPANNHFGAWVYYIALGGANTGGDTCGSQNKSVVNADGYSFPVAPQRKSENGRVPAMSALPCSTICHHDGTPALDLSRLPGGDEVAGTPVIAISDGTIFRIRDNYRGQPGCITVQLLSSKDQFYYAYLHISNAKVQEKQEVKAGDQIAEIGERRCTGNGSDNHLHIDRGCIENGQPQTGGDPACRDAGFVPLINAIYEELPE